jgi:peptidoglycan hydrolase CwlO-like protein
MTMQNENRSGRLKNWLIALLLLGLIGSWIYMLMDQQDKKTTIEKQQADISSLDASKLRLQEAFDESLVRLDSLGSFNDSLRSEVSGLQKDIEGKKAEIRKILKDKNAKQADLEKARLLISELNDRIMNLDAEVARLSGENKRLTIDKEQLQRDKAQLEEDLGATRAEKEELSSTVDKGSTFVASNIQVQPVDERRSGKEKSTARAKRVDKLMISFDVENRIAKSGPTNVVLIVAGPDGQVITSGTENQYNTKEDGTRTITASMEVNYTQGSKQNIQYPLRGSFQSGSYKIEIYQNGYKIGSAERQLK